MASNSVERIDSLYDVPSITKENENLVKQLRDILKVMGDVQKGINAVANSKGGGGLLTGTTQLTKAQQELAKQTILAEKAIQSKQRTEQQAAKTTQENEKASQQLLKTQKAQQSQSNATSAASKREQKDAEDLMNDYKQLSLTYNEAALKAKNYALRFGESHPVTVQAIKDANEMGNTLKRLDSAVGQNQRNVGNYKSAFDGLSMSFTQVARELPSLAVSPATFFLAISNNLPMVQDEIAKAKNEINALKAAGKDAPSLFSRIGASLFSPQVGLSILVTLLTLLGPKLVSFISNMIDGGEAAKAMAEAQQKLNEITREQTRVNKELDDTYKSRLNLLRQINETEQSQENELNKARAENRSRSELLAIEQKIANSRALSANVAFFKEGGFDKEQEANLELIAAKQRLVDLQKEYASMLKADAYDNTATEEELADAEKRISMGEKELKFQMDNYNTIKKINEENAASIAARAEKEIEIRTYQEEQKRKVTLESAKNTADTIKQINDDTLADERSTLKQRIAALRSSAKAEKSIASAELNDILNDPSTVGTAERMMAYKNYAKQIKDIDRQLSVDIYTNREDYRRRDLAAQLDIDKTNIEQHKVVEKELSEATEISLKDRFASAAKYYDDQKALIDKQYAHDVDIAKASGKTQLELQDLQVKYNSDLVTLNANSQKQISEIIKAELDRRRRDQEDYFQDIDLLSLVYSATEAEDYAKGTLALAKSFNNRKITYKQYKEGIEQLDKTMSINTLHNTIQALEAQLDYLEANYPKVADVIRTTEENINALKKDLEVEKTETVRIELIERLRLLEIELKAQKKAASEIAAVRKAIAEAQAKGNKDKGEDPEKERIKRLTKLSEEFAAFQQITNNAFAAAGEIISIGLDKRKFAIEQIESKQQETYANEIKRINSLNISDAQRADMLKSLEAQRTAEKIINDRKLRKIEIDRAKFERASNIANIITGTALAVVNALKSGGPLAIPLAISVGVLGAAQLARAIATPLPQYFTGTENAKRGFAWVGEKGTERVETKSGQVSYTPNKPTLAWLEGGEKITPHHRLADYLPQVAMSKPIYYNSQSDNGIGLFTTSMTDAISLQTYRLEKAMKKKNKFVVNNHINNGWSDYLNRKVYNK